jgi:hypothetical protein
LGHDLDEHVRTVALTRSLTTQAVVLPLPASIVTGDMFALPSLRAALLLGLREQASPARDEAVQQQRIAGSVVDRFFDGHDAQMVRSPTELLAQSKGAATAMTSTSTCAQSHSPGH